MIKSMSSRDSDLGTNPSSTIYCVILDKSPNFSVLQLLISKTGTIIVLPVRLLWRLKEVIFVMHFGQRLIYGKHLVNDCAKIISKSWMLLILEGNWGVQCLQMWVISKTKSFTKEKRTETNFPVINPFR
jgi:hypothetical protein